MGWLRLAGGRPKLDRLKELLLMVGGERFQRDDFLDAEMRDYELDALLDRGELHDGSGAEMAPGEVSGCHDNSCRLALENEGWQMWTGLALSPDGIWRVHSWAVRPDGRIVETTVGRVLYFGVPVDPARYL